MLLAIDHLQKLDKNIVKDKIDELATTNSLFKHADILLLYDKIGSIKIFRRTNLPTRCFKCGNADFDYTKLKCTCGTSLYAETDSMSALIRMK